MIRSDGTCVLLRQARARPQLQLPAVSIPSMLAARLPSLVLACRARRKLFYVSCQPMQFCQPGGVEFMSTYMVTRSFTPHVSQDRQANCNPMALGLNRTCAGLQALRPRRLLPVHSHSPACPLLPSPTTADERLWPAGIGRCPSLCMDPTQEPTPLQGGNLIAASLRRPSCLAASPVPALI